MTLQLIKVEEGLAQGNVLYHGFSKCRKTPSPVKVPTRGLRPRHLTPFPVCFKSTKRRRR